MGNWAEALTYKHAKKMSKGIENLGRYLKQIELENQCQGFPALPVSSCKEFNLLMDANLDVLGI
jgi:hypothetical protein